MRITLEGKRALVTGGNSGIGRAITRSLVEAGAKVAINYLTHPETASSLLDETTERGGTAISVQADVSDPSAVAAMFRKVDEVWGGIDLLVNNAGMDGVRCATWESEVADWRKVLEVNLFGAYYCAREALGRMVPQKGGVVLNITSVHEEIAWSGHGAYTASKAALGMLTKNIAQEGAPYGIRALAVAPGAVETDINRPVWTDPKGKRDLLDKIPLRRLGTPEEIASLVVVLLSDRASYLTGRTVYIDGGMTDFPDFAHGG
ncbi:glucose-1-dehydrogenase [Geomonas sp. Red276]